MTSTGDEDRKMFVGGLPQEAGENDVKEYFEQIAEVESINLKMDNSTGRSRGFAFLVFTTKEGLAEATKETSHVIKDKKVTVKKAEVKPGKVYVGKLPEGITEEDIKNHFSEFGTVTELVRKQYLDTDAQKQMPKNFCFITFEREEVAKKLIKEGSTSMNGKTVIIKTVVQKQPGIDADYGNGMGYGGVFGGGWGYSDPYGGYGHYGGYGGYYDGYGGYGGGYGGYSGGKMTRGRGRGRSGPY